MGHRSHTQPTIRRPVRVALGLAVLAGLSGCGTLGSAFGATTTGCADGEEIAGWCADTRAQAAEAYPYAMMASLAYMQPSKDYALPADWRVRARFGNDARGFAYSVFDRFEDDELVETAIAFRGTEFGTFEDWWHGNLLLRQNPRGREIVAQIRAGLDEAGHTDVPIRVAGHSLGGAIATYSGRYPTRESGEAESLPERVYAFNSSPRDGWGGSDDRRLAINERGEILASLRAVFFPLGGATKTINCAPGLRVIGDHSITQMTDCLTWIAAYEEDSADSLRALADNPAIDRPRTQLEQTQPPGLELARSYVPVNLHYFGGWPQGNELVIALNDALKADPLLEPSQLRSAFAIHIIPDADAEATPDGRLRFTVAWSRNLEVVSVTDMDCAVEDLESCVEAIVADGRALHRARLPSG